MGGFDAVNHAMSTIATGGFSTKNASIAGFDNLYIEIVIILFMYLSGINFTLQYRAFFQRQPKALLQSPELRLYTTVMAAAVVVMTLNVWLAGVYDSIATALRYVSFQVVSIMTTTGFGTADFAGFRIFPFDASKRALGPVPSVGRSSCG